ncbi:MAG: TonB-dependent receptor [Bacteroidales bacterium]|nr:TonB-dependent receptor [Bacteroidales bacterium]
MKKKLLLLLLIANSVLVIAQTGIQGVVRNTTTGDGIADVQVVLKKNNVFVLTNEKGEFTFNELQAGSDVLEIVHPVYVAKPLQITIAANRISNIGIIRVRDDQSVVREVAQDIANVITLDSELATGDETTGSATRGTALSARGDVYAAATNYTFSAMRFRTRGYDNTYENTYINGVNFNSLPRGMFNYSMLGGLNDAMRNKDVNRGLSPTAYSYGNIAGVTNIDTRASQYALGTRTSVAFSNRSYTLRAQALHARDLGNDLYLAVSGVARWADEGIIEGSFYNSAGLFTALEKKFADKHSLSLTLFAAPTQRGQQAASLQEVYDLAGSIYYNSYWGYQDGQKRNSRVVETIDPTAVVSYEWKIDPQQVLRAGFGYHYNFYSNSALNFYNAPDPRPDYYRYLPSFQTTQEDKDLITSLWKTNPSVSQINWDELYRANYALNTYDEEMGTESSAKYALERRHNDLEELTFNAAYVNQFTKALKLTVGIEAKNNVGKHYKTMEDLLGGKRWIDTDQFAERDFADNPDIIQNDLRDPNRVIGVGDIFGYHYNMHVFNAKAFIANDWTISSLDFYYAGQLSYTQFFREGFMENGRATDQGIGSYGVGDLWFFTDPSVKAGMTYHIDGRNRISYNMLGEYRAPLVNNAYVSPRIKDELIPYLTQEKVLSYDLAYEFVYPTFRGRLSAFQTHVYDAVENMGYYDDENRTFVNHSLYDVNKVYRGVEAGVAIQLPYSLTLSLAGTLADYHYKDDSQGIMSAENGSDLDGGVEGDILEIVKTKDLKINAGPQTAASVKLSYVHPEMWFADVSVSYYDDNYLDFSANRFRESNVGKYDTDEKLAAFGTQEKLPAGFLVDASLGKIFYLKNRSAVNFNISANNVLNNTSMITGGYQQARLPLDDGVIDKTKLDLFANKYYYALGFNFFVHVGYRF